MPDGRYAPSPTGTLHLGNLRTAVAAWLFARVGGAAFRLRWEDLDHTADPAHEHAQLADLETLGLDFDGTPVHQSERIDAYREVLADLVRAGHTYRCWCSRREIREAAAAPHGTPGAYPGTCRELSTSEIAAREASGRPPALRLRTHDAEVEIVDSLHGIVRRRIDDFVLQRGDGVPAYHLVVVVDDEYQAVGEVVRGADLLDSTPRHAFLQRLLGYREPRWSHVPLVLDATDDRLSKRDGSAGLAAWHHRGGTVGGLLASFGTSLGIEVDGPVTASDLVEGFEPSGVPLTPIRYIPDPPELSPVP
jgi:glutamyl-tRNA synthetase